MVWLGLGVANPNPNLSAPDEAALRVHCSADCAAHEALYSLALNRTISLALPLFLNLALALTLNPNPEP